MKLKVAICIVKSILFYIEKGLYQSISDLNIDEAWIVAPVDDTYPLKENVWVMPLAEAINRCNSVKC